jgi:hypothetical protein
VTFTLNGSPASATPAAAWQAGGLPPDVANGYVLAAQAATPTATSTAVAPPKTGNAGILGGSPDNTAGWMILTIGLLALGAVVGTRAYAGRNLR